MRRTFASVCLLLLALTVVCCGPKKPAATNSNAAPTPSPSPAAANKSAKGQVTKPGEKPPEVAKTGVPQDKIVPVPENWETYYDAQKGYQFEVPSGTETNQQTVDGVDVFMAKLPDPTKVGVMVVAFKNKNLTKADLLETAKRILASMGEKDIKAAAPTELSDDYDLVELSSVDEKGVTTRAKVLLATDVTDNYVVLVGSPDSDYKANEKIIDGIWGSFSMYSGGASGNS
jgi:hypothetical protein